MWKNRECRDALAHFCKWRSSAGRACKSTFSPSRQGAWRWSSGAPSVPCTCNVFTPEGTSYLTTNYLGPPKTLPPTSRSGGRPQLLVLLRPRLAVSLVMRKFFVGDEELESARGMYAFLTFAVATWARKGSKKKRGDRRRTSPPFPSFEKHFDEHAIEKIGLEQKNGDVHFWPSPTLQSPGSALSMLRVASPLGSWPQMTGTGFLLFQFS